MLANGLSVKCPSTHATICRTICWGTSTNPPFREIFCPHHALTPQCEATLPHKGPKAADTNQHSPFTFLCFISSIIHDRHLIPVAEEARALKRLGGALVLADMSVEDAEPHLVGIDGTQSPRAANGAGRPGAATTATAGDELVPDEARCLAVDAAAGWVGVKSVGGAFALKELTAAGEARIGTLVKKAVS